MRSRAKFRENNCYMGKTSINVDSFYCKRAYYPFIPAPVFDTLEAAYLDGKETAEISDVDYSEMMSNLQNANLCHELT